MIRASIQVGWKSIPGQRHRAEGRENEDAVVVATGEAALDALLLVADGMGGHSQPQLAAQTAAGEARAFLAAAERGERPLGEQLRLAVARADAAVTALGGQGNGKPPGTTLTIAAVCDGQLHLAHVGDGSVFLHRSGRAQRLVGGEERRVGSRPENYLGSGASLELEEASVALAAGDRVLICTDGLTRYFTGDDGLRAMAEILGRERADPQAIAGQLTAHSRSDEYDDDTSVVVAEVTELREVAAPRVSERRASRPAAAWPSLLVGMLLGGALFGGGFVAGRRASPASAPEVLPAANGSRDVPLATDADLAALPKGNLVLLDDVGQRVYLLRTSPLAGTGEKPISLRAFRLGANSRFQEAGRFTLNTALSRLSSPEGRVYPVARDPATGLLQVQRAGTLAVLTDPKGARCWIDGHEVGATPRTETVAAGRHTVRIVGEGAPIETIVDVPAGRTVTLSLTPRK